VVQDVQQGFGLRSVFLKHQAAAEAAADGFFSQMGSDQLLSDLMTRSARLVRRSTLVSSSSARRMDAEFFTEAFERLESRMKKIGAVKTLGDITSSVTTGRTPAAAEYFDEDQGEAVVLKVGVLTNQGANWAAAEFAPRKYVGHADSDAAEGDVLFTSSAHSPSHIARKADVVRGIPREYANRTMLVGELMRLRIKDQDEMPPEYVASFLRNAIGGEQVRRCIRGITSHVYPQDIRAFVRIPVPPAGVKSAIASESAKASKARWDYHGCVRRAIARLDDHIEKIL
jgi:hypothetical protein